MINLRKPKGFSLIELLVVVAIIGILASVGILAFNGFVKNARLNEAKQSIQSIVTQEEQYKAQQSIYYTTGANANCTDATTASIISNLFGGQEALDNKYFSYCIESVSGSASGELFRVHGIRKSDNEDYWMNNNLKRSTNW